MDAFAAPGTLLEHAVIGTLCIILKRKTVFNEPVNKVPIKKRKIDFKNISENSRELLQ